MGTWTTLNWYMRLQEDIIGIEGRVGYSGRHMGGVLGFFSID
jgi:hypothetical protein